MAVSKCSVLPLSVEARAGRGQGLLHTAHSPLVEYLSVLVYGSREPACREDTNDGTTCHNKTGWLINICAIPDTSLHSIIT